MRPFLLFPVALLLFLCSADAQTGHPQGYFRNPLGIPILLAGNFGECRPGHFHMGIDIKTQGRENLPVYAAADGFIARIKTEPGGFGHALYIQHPNGHTTLYAHLNDFKAEVQSFLRTKQYADEKWEQDIALPAGRFPVKKGEQIAWSGNTGGSTAPHLHFEIRDTKTERVLNPQLFGLEIEDTRAPVPTSVAVYQYEPSVFYELEPEQYKLKKMGAVYAPLNDTITTGIETGIGIVANDYMNGSTNTLAFRVAELYADDILQQRIVLDEVGYDETRYVNAYADYRMKAKGSPWIQCLFRLPGNELARIYGQDGNGILQTGQKEFTNVRVVLTDANGNISTVQFVLKNKGGGSAIRCKRLLSEAIEKGIEYPNIRYQPAAGALYAYGCEHYATVPDAKALSDRYQINDAAIPIHSYFPVSVKPTKLIPFAMRSKVVMVCREGKDEDGKAAKPEQGWYSARFRSFGEFRLVIDTLPPVISPRTAPEKWGREPRKADKKPRAPQRIVFTVRDAATRVKSFRAELDGKWILFEQHGSSWFYVFDAHCPPGKHVLTLTAKDENDNAVVKRYTFTR